MFGPLRGPLPHQWNSTVKHMIKTLWWDKAKSWLVIWTKYKNTTNRTTMTRPQTWIVTCKLYETVWGGSRYLIWGPTHRIEIKERAKAIYHNLDNNHACSLLHIIHVVTYLFVASVIFLNVTERKTVQTLFSFFTKKRYLFILLLREWLCTFTSYRPLRTG